MFDFSRFTGSLRLSKRMERSMRHTFTVVTALFHSGNGADGTAEVREPESAGDYIGNGEKHHSDI